MTAVTGRSTGGDTRVALRPLSLVEDGGDVVVGDPATGSFVAIPAIGGVVIRALQAGATLAEAAAEAEQHAGEPVDVAAFVAALRELGFLDDGSRAEPARTAPVQQRRWLAGVPQRWAARMFGRIAWSCYAAALVFCVACFALRPSLWPHPAEVGRDGVVLTLALLLTLLLSGVHEGWHWLAARALGLPVRFGVDRRLFFLVFETDLSLLWTVPRRQRYGPQLAGLAIDSVVLAGLLGMQLSAAAGRLPLAGSTARLVAAVAYLKVGTMLWQCLVFLRTDLYGVLVTATGCRNLWAVKSLQLRQAFGRLTADQAAELAAADPARRPHRTVVPLAVPRRVPRHRGLPGLLPPAGGRVGDAVVLRRTVGRARARRVLGDRGGVRAAVPAAAGRRRTLASRPRPPVTAAALTGQTNPSRCSPDCCPMGKIDLRPTEWTSSTR